ncbi:hypothetical protein [Rhizobium populisoli]|uniref:hypothetical protein n=1 Tax=Rhizobium populisoli TaxID=2859785 RepID=UPI001FEB0DC2|nr:hypothetical protein [Rhizobium populisoli]
MYRFRAMCCAASLTVCQGASASAASQVDGTYVRSLAAPGKTVLVIEYYDGQKSIVGRIGFASANGFQPVSPTTFNVDDRVSLQLFGVEPCQGDMVNRTEGFAGRCDDFAKGQLAIKLKAARVLYCRAFVSEQGARSQDVTCFGYYHYPGTLDTIDNIEEQLVSLGALRLSKKAGGGVLRPDLVQAEKIGRGGFGMWADPRVKSQ